MMGAETRRFSSTMDEENFRACLTAGPTATLEHPREVAYQTAE